MEIVALEYRQGDFGGAEALAERAAQVADACAWRGLEAVSMVGLMQGRPIGPGLVFGLRADDVEGAALFADAIGARGYVGVVTFGMADILGNSQISPADWVGLGLLPVQGGDEVFVRASKRRVLERFSEPGSAWGDIWMPGVDEVGRAVDGLVLELARRKEVELIWAPGSGLNDDEALFGEPALLTAYVDDGRKTAEGLAAYCGGDSVERWRAQVMRGVEVSRRWIQEFNQGSSKSAR